MQQIEGEQNIRIREPPGKGERHECGNYPDKYGAKGLSYVTTVREAVQFSH